MTERLPQLRMYNFQVDDDGNHIDLHAAAQLDATEVAQLRDWLTAWLERQ
jgi:hypothetical protein